MKYAIILLVAVGLIVAGTSNAFATTGTSSGDPIYMDFNNLAIKGEVAAKDHPGWIEVNSFQWGVGRAISSPIGGGGIREAGAPNVSEFVITKTMDKSSPGLLKQAFAGTAAPVTIDLVRPSSTGVPTTYAEYKLQGVLISGYSVSSGGDTPTESISLSFTKITFAFPPGGTSGTSITWDISLGKVV